MIGIKGKRCVASSILQKYSNLERRQNNSSFFSIPFSNKEKPLHLTPIVLSPRFTPISAVADRWDSLKSLRSLRSLKSLKSLRSLKYASWCAERIKLSVIFDAFGQKIMRFPRFVFFSRHGPVIFHSFFSVFLRGCKACHNFALERLRVAHLSLHKPRKMPRLKS